MRLAPTFDPLLGSRRPLKQRQRTQCTSRASLRVCAGVSLPLRSSMMSWPRVFIRREIEQKKCDPPMNTPSTTSEYLLLIRNTTWHKNVSPKDIQKLVKQFTTLAERLSNEGRIKRGYPPALESSLNATIQA